MDTNVNRQINAVRRGGQWALALMLAFALSPRPAAAQDNSVPVSTFEAGGLNVSNGSYKAGEYNGLQNQGGLFIGNFDFRGRERYDGDSAYRWRATGVDLGLDTRSLSARFGVQGKFRVSLGFDELRRNRSDTYQTPYLGAGTDTLTLPIGWLIPTIAGSSSSNNVVNSISARGLVPSIGTAAYIDTRSSSPTQGGLLTPTAAQIASVTGAAAADVPLFANYNVATTRAKGDVALTYNFDPQWSMSVEYQPEHKTGVKPLGTVSRESGGDISTVIPDVVDTNTHQINLRLNFNGEHSYLQTAYYGEIFTNLVPYMSWQNWATGTVTTGGLNAGSGEVNVMSSAPSNQFHQFSAAGGFNLTKSTKLVLNGSAGRNTQNAAFLTDPTTVVVPVSSLNGLVVTETFGAKLTSRPAKGLNLSAAYKFDNHDDRTAVHIFQYSDAGDDPSASTYFPAGPNNPLGAVLAQNANANRPYSKRENQFTADADYQLAPGQGIRGTYAFDRINRWCPGSWISCADAAVTNENSVGAEYRVTLPAQLTVRAGYTYARRRTPDYNENAFLAIVPYANVVPVGATGGATAYSFMAANGWNGWGPALGYAPTSGNMLLFFPSNNALANALYANENRISELPGMRRYYVADRNSNKLRTAVMFQATDALSFQADANYDKDDYTDAVYGLQNNSNWTANVEGTYVLGTNVSVDGFYEYESYAATSAGNTYSGNSTSSSVSGLTGLSGNACDGYVTLQQRNNNNKLDPCLPWFSDRADKLHSVGVSLIRKGLLSHLDLTGNFTLSRDRSDNNVTGGNWANNILVGPGAPPTTIAAYFIPATALPTVFTNTYELRANGTYNLNTRQAVRVLYTYMRMRSADWSYEGMQFGSLSGVLPTNEQPFVYAVHVVAVSYVMSF
jgi:MtrB/PioB family decaheme-associated outer membrane protein